MPSFTIPTNISTQLFVIYFLQITIPLYTGIVAYGDDTGAFDFPYRILASQLAQHQDTLIWYPYAGDGTPNLTLEYVGLTWNPLGILIGLIKPYDYQSLALEITIWRAIGAAGCYALAKHSNLSHTASLGVAATYIGSGTMSRAALSLVTLVGQMSAPWCLLASTRILKAETTKDTLYRTVQFSAVYGASIWSGYIATALFIPIVTSPLIALRSHKRVLTNPVRTIFALIAAISLTLLYISPLIHETLSGPLSHFDINYRNKEATMLVGHARSIDFIGLLVPNPSYALPNGPDDLQPIYGGLLPLLILLSLAHTPISTRSMHVLMIFPIAGLSLILSNTLPAPFNSHHLYTSNPALLVILHLIIPLLYAIRRIPRIQHSNVNTAFLLILCAAIFVISTDNPLANYLRNNVPPFSLIRHNFLWFWVVSLFTSIVAWTHIDTSALASQTSTLTPKTSHLSTPTMPRSSRPYLVPAALMILLTVLYPVYSLPPNVTNRDEAVGTTHLIWQLISALLFLGLFIWHNSKPLTTTTSRLPLPVASAISIQLLLFAFLILYGDSIRAQAPETLYLLTSDTWRKFHQLMFFLVTIACTLFALHATTDDGTRKISLLCVVLIDMSIAMYSYYYDSERFGIPHKGWPWKSTTEEARQTSNGFRPKTNDGHFKADIWQPFTGTFRPYPAVQEIRHYWEAAYEQWILYPTEWYSKSNSIDIFVPRNAINHQTHTAAPKWTATWAVDASRTGGRNNEREYQSLNAYENNLRKQFTQHNTQCDTEPDASNASFEYTVRLILSTHISFTTSTPCTQLLVFTDSWAPSWTAYVDNVQTQVYRVNNAIRAIYIPPGTHSVTWIYDTFTIKLLAIFPMLISGASIAPAIRPMKHSFTKMFLIAK